MRPRKHRLKGTTMSKKFDFETIHENKKWAFIDGFLTALVIAAPAVVLWVKTVRDDRNTISAMLDEAESKINHLQNAA